MSTAKKQKTAPKEPLKAAVVTMAEFKPAPRRYHGSMFDKPAAKLLEVGKGQGVKLEIPDGRDPVLFRSQVYTGMQKAIKRLKPTAKVGLKIRLAHDLKSFAISLA